MSTMYDALRKAESERKRSMGGSRESGSSDSGGGDNSKVIILAIAVVCVFAFAAFRVYSMQNHKAPAPKPVASSIAAQPAAQAGAQPVLLTAPVKPPRAPGVYELVGVIDAGESSMAIVNDKLLKVGDTIDHLTLQKISPKEVEMVSSKDNSTVVLQITK